MCVGMILLTCMQLLIVHITNNPTVILPFMALFGLSLSSAPLDQQSNYNNNYQYKYQCSNASRSSVYYDGGCISIGRIGTVNQLALRTIDVPNKHRAGVVSNKYFKMNIMDNDNSSGIGPQLDLTQQVHRRKVSTFKKQGSIRQNQWRFLEAYKIGIGDKQ